MHGYQLRVKFETATGGMWPLNVGQVYTTLARLERDGFVVQDAPPDDDGEGKIVYRLTETGRRELTGWFETAIERRSRPRDELAIKLALALTTPGVDVEKVVQAQRAATLRTLQELTRLKVQTDASADPAWLLVNEAMIFQADAEARWLDFCEAALGARERSLAPSSPIEQRTEATR
jgi:DNA-binding PadR family transcriptional regulator